MKSEIERIKANVLRIRRSRESTPTMTALALDDIADALEKIDERLTKLEAVVNAPLQFSINGQRANAQEVTDFLNSLPVYGQRPHDWAIGAKV